MKIEILIFLIAFAMLLGSILKVTWYEYKGRKHIRANYPDEWIDNFMMIRGGYGGSVYNIFKLKVNDPEFNELKTNYHNAFRSFIILAILTIILFLLFGHFG